MRGFTFDVVISGGLIGCAFGRGLPNEREWYTDKVTFEVDWADRGRDRVDVVVKLLNDVWN